MMDEEVLQFYSEYEEKFRKKLMSFYQYRVLFSLLVESIILTDRLLFLKENRFFTTFHGYVEEVGTKGKI